MFIKQTLLAFTGLFLFTALPAQTPATTAPVENIDPTIQPVDGTIKLGPGESVTDGKSTVTNNGTKGSLRVRYTGKRKKVDTKYTVGKIEKITDPASGGTFGPIDINTGGEETDIDIDKNGLNGKPVKVNVDGGKANINVDGNHTEGTVGGTGNEVDITGNDNKWGGKG